MTRISLSYLRPTFFDEIIGFNKIKNLDNKQVMSLPVKLMELLSRTRKEELEIEIITENFHDHGNGLYSVTNYGSQHEIIDAIGCFIYEI
jgi:hypothetical protein